MSELREKAVKKTAIVVCGPTAVGKTSVALTLAQQFDSEIISFDSRQFYKELKIGAAPPSEEELQKVPHYFVGNLSLKEKYNAGRFEQEALEFLNSFFKTKNQAVLVGGSGLYLKALEQGFDDIPKVDESYRNQLNEELEKFGLEKLTAELQEKDAAYFQKVDAKNPQRVLRALEVIRATGQPFSSFQKNQNRTKRNFDFIKIGLELPREELYERINARVDKMIEAGLENEVKNLLSFRNENAMQTVGYKEFIKYFDGELSREKAISEIKKNTRRYAKRQMTWFRKDAEIHWFSPKNFDQIQGFLYKKISE